MADGEIQTEARAAEVPGRVFALVLKAEPKIVIESAPVVGLFALEKLESAIGSTDAARSKRNQILIFSVTVKKRAIKRQFCLKVYQLLESLR